jgi:GntR family transcriptional regulator
MDLRVDPDRPPSPSQQIVTQVLDAVAAGRLSAGERLPSVRDAAGQALVNPNTVARAWRDLEALGVVKGRAGAGVFVTDDGPDVARRERRKATLAAVRLALEEALRSGHSIEDVMGEAKRAADRARERAERTERARDASDSKGGRR